MGQLLLRLARAGRSLRVRLLTLGLLCILPVAMLLLRSAEQHRDLLIAEAGERLATAASLLAAEHERIVNQASLLLRVLGNDPAVRGSDMGACSRRLAQVVVDAAMLSNIVLVTPAGDMVCSGTPIRPTNIADRSYFKAAMQGKPAVGPLVFTRSSSKYLLPISVPILGRDGRPWRVLATGVTPETLRAFAVGVNLAQNAGLTLLDSAGDVVASTVAGLDPGAPGPWQPLALRVGVSEIAASLVGVAHAAQGALTIVVARPRDAVLAASDAIYRREIIWVAAVMLLVGLAAAVAAEIWIVRRVRSLAGIAARLTEGEFSARADLRPGADEIGQLARALDTMAASLDVRVSDLEGREAQARRESLHDPLTGLPNRRSLDRELGTMIGDARRAGAGLAVLALDLDRFKAVNDTHGHATGDALLLAAALRMRTALREPDRLARIAGDEFVAVVQVGIDDAVAESIAERLVQTLAMPFELHGRRVHTSASIGIAYHPRDGSDGAALIEAADRALYRSKADGRGRWSVERAAA